MAAARARPTGTPSHQRRDGRSGGSGSSTGVPGAGAATPAAAVVVVDSGAGAVVVDASGAVIAIVVAVAGGVVVVVGFGRVVVVVALGRVVVVVGAVGAVVTGGAADAATRPESASAMSDDVSTASKAPAVIVFSWSRRSVSQPGSDVPVKYQLEPLSATTRPWRCMARSTTWVSGRWRDTSKLAFRRNHAPIGGRDGSLAAPAW